MKGKRLLRLLTIFSVLLFLMASLATVACSRQEKKTFVLVHGAWHGGWAWERLVPYLTNAGYKVYTPTLTGMENQANQANPDTGVSTHIQDILNLLVKENLHNVVLVGHSYGGMVIAGVADKAPERISQLVYLDAFVPKDGQSLGDIIGPQGMTGIRQGAKAVGDGWRIPSFPVERFGITSEADIAFVKPKLVTQPLKTFDEPVQLKNPAATALPRTFIYLSNPPMGTFEGFAKIARESSDWKYYELATGHDAMVLEPQKLSELFLKIAQEPDKKK